MTDAKQLSPSEQLTRRLRELIVALDRRVPRPERVAEAAIARDSVELRKNAVNRLAEIVDPGAPVSDDLPD